MRFLSETYVQALGWTLIHSLWQGVVVAIVCAIGLRAIPRAAANARYAFACAMLTGMVAIAVMTFAWVREGSLGNRAMSSEVGQVFKEIAKPQATAETVTREQPLSPMWKQNLVEWIVLGWVCGVSGLSAWHVMGWLWIQRMRAGATEIARWSTTVSRLRERLEITRVVRLIECARIDVPAVVGALRPVILVPVGLLSGLSAVQVETILLHELAHIRRHDYLVNLLQTAAETLLFYHPAAWWISAQIRAERENACDDVVVKISGDAVGYAEALAALEQSRIAPLRLSLAANDGNLIERVRRMLRLPPKRKTPVRSLAATVLALACGCAPLVASKSEKPNPATSTETAAVKPAAPQEVDATRGITLNSDPTKGITIRSDRLVVGPATAPATGRIIGTIDGGIITLRQPGPSTAPTSFEFQLEQKQPFVGVLSPATTQAVIHSGTLNITDFPRGTLMIVNAHEFFRVVVAAHDLKHDGKPIDTAALRKMFGDMPEEKRSKTVLEVAAMQDATFGSYEEIFGEMSALVRELKMAYVSNVGIQRAAPTTIDASAREADRQLYLQQKARREEFEKEFDRQLGKRQSNPPTTEPVSAALRAHEQALELRLEKLKTQGIGEKNPKYLQTQEEIKAVRGKIDQMEKAKPLDQRAAATTKSS